MEGLDAHHVGQKALMKKVVADYDELTAPAINVPKLGHTKRHPERGIVSRSTKGITNARQLLARDLFELKRVHREIRWYGHIMRNVRQREKPVSRH